MSPLKKKNNESNLVITKNIKTGCFKNIIKNLKSIEKKLTNLKIFKHKNNNK